MTDSQNNQKMVGWSADPTKTGILTQKIADIIEGVIERASEGGSTNYVVAQIIDTVLSEVSELINDPTKGSKYIPADIRTYKAELQAALNKLRTK